MLPEWNLPSSTASSSPRQGLGAEYDLFGACLDALGRIPRLGAKEERLLFQRLNRVRRRLKRNPHDFLAREEWIALRGRLAAANMRLVVALAKKFQGGGLGLADLVQEGALGLLQAVDRYDLRRGVPFGAYAAWWIQQAMRQALLRVGRTVRIPAYLVHWQRRVRRAQEEVGELAALSVLAERAGLTEEQVQRALDAQHEIVSLEAEPESDRLPLRDRLADPVPVQPDRFAEQKEQERLLQEALSLLDERSARILRLRYGLEDGVARSLKEVGDRMGLSKERIRQIEAAAFRKLRHSPIGHRLRDYLETG